MTYFQGCLGACMIGVALLSHADAGFADTPARLTGIDLSHHNEVSDWSKVKDSELSFVVLKATDGMDYLDPTFSDRFTKLDTLGLIRGGYHFYETNDDPLVQANWFIKNVPLQAGDLPPIVDIERVKAPVANDLHRDFELFLKTLEDHYGTKPIIYTGPEFWNHAMKDHLPAYPLWVAEYGKDTPTLPEGWQNWTMWQFTDTHVVPGISDPTDGNHFNGDVTDLQSILLPAS